MGQPDTDFISEQMAKAVDDIERELEELEKESIVEDEEVQTEYGSFTKPVVSNSQLPDIKTYDSVEELQAVVDEKNKLREEAEAEEEYEEITIPSTEELQRMTKSNIFGEAKKLNFDSVVMTMTKSDMIEEFSKRTEEFIAGLQESGELVSSEGLNFAEAEINNEKESDEDNSDNKDGGYF